MNVGQACYVLVYSASAQQLMLLFVFLTDAAEDCYLKIIITPLEWHQIICRQLCFSFSNATNTLQTKICFAQLQQVGCQNLKLLLLLYNFDVGFYNFFLHTGIYFHYLSLPWWHLEKKKNNIARNNIVQISTFCIEFYTMFPINNYPPLWQMMTCGAILFLQVYKQGCLTLVKTV